MSYTAGGLHVSVSPVLPPLQPAVLFMASEADSMVVDTLPAVLADDPVRRLLLMLYRRLRRVNPLCGGNVLGADCCSRT